MTVADNLRTKGATEKGTAEASVLIGDTRYDLPMRKGTLGPDVVDVGTLYQDTGCFTYDPGFTSTASCESKISSIAVTRSNNSLSTALFLKHVTSCSTASCRPPNRTRRLNTASSSTLSAGRRPYCPQRPAQQTSQPVPPPVQSELS